jgi:hypothetical protein
MPREKFRLTRRSVLKGAGGVTLALPFLELMSDRGGRAFAQSADAPLRYLVCFGGQSMGADNDPLHDDYVPDIVGPDYDLKSALAPLAGVKNEVSVVSGLRIPTASENGGQIPAGGRPDDFHVSTASPLLSGTRASSSVARCNGPTSDQLVAQAFGNVTPFASLVYRIQAAWYLSVSAPYGRDLLSYKLDSTSKVVGIPATVSPRQAFTSLFGNFVPPGNDGERARQQALLESRRSVLDLVRGSTERLMKEVGREDSHRLGRHLEEVRALELRIQDLPPEAEGVCVAPSDPGPDPALGGNQPDGQFTTNNGYSDEEARARIFCDLVHMAFACDLTRVATLQFTMFQSHLNMFPLIGVADDLHEIGHSGKGTLAMAKAQAWHMKHFAYLLAKLRDTPEPGGNMLDNMAIVFLHEGGHGLDPSSGKQNSSHSSERMACLVAGRAGGLKPGRHVVAQDQHPARVLTTAMKAVGVQTDSLGEVHGDLPALRT